MCSIVKRPKYLPFGKLALPVARVEQSSQPIESIKRVTGQPSNAIVLDYVAAATLEDDPPLLEIVR